MVSTCYLVNRSSSTAIDFRIPIEVWSNKPVEYSMLKVFECPTYYHVRESKLEPRAKKGVFMGYGDGVKGFRIWLPSGRKVIVSTNVIFDELSMFHSKSEEDSGKAKDATKLVKFESPTIKNLVIRRSLKHLMRLIRNFKCNLNIRIQHQLRSLIRQVRTI